MLLFIILISIFFVQLVSLSASSFQPDEHMSKNGGAVLVCYSEAAVNSYYSRIPV